MTTEQKEVLYKELQDLMDIYNEYNPLTNEGFKLDSVKACYEAMFKYVFKDEDKINTLNSWLDSHDFWKTPASTRFHGDFESGLCVHTMQVILQSLKFSKAVFQDYFDTKLGENFTCTASDVFVAALSHDFCKSGSYEISFRNTKDVLGNWVKKSFYKTRENIRSLGHGNESVLCLLEIFPEYIHNRNVLEAVSRHMGFSDLTDTERMNYSNFLTNPLVILLQLADEISASWYGN